MFSFKHRRHNQVNVMAVSSNVVNTTWLHHDASELSYIHVNCVQLNNVLTYAYVYVRTCVIIMSHVCLRVCGQAATTGDDDGGRSNVVDAEAQSDVDDDADAEGQEEEQSQSILTGFALITYCR